jgi:hypothetical protein
MWLLKVVCCCCPCHLLPLLLPAGGDAVDAQAAAAAANAEVKQYQQPGYTTTVCITNFNAGYDDRWV